jgi:hypothetical protein
MGNELEQLQHKLRELSLLVTKYHPDFAPQFWEGFSIDLRGYSNSILSLAVHKQTDPPEFATEQATFMMFLGDFVCPKILSMNSAGYVMEYLQPAKTFVNTIRTVEKFLECYVWNKSLEDVPYAKQIGDETWQEELEISIGVKIPEWALDFPCLIHGDPTLDNCLETQDGFIRITDPIPPHRLVRPSIRAIDHGKMLQSLLGWEVVLRGMPRIEYAWPEFMLQYETARRATFWCMVALKRIALRNNICNAGEWAENIGRELEECMS